MKYGEQKKQVSVFERLTERHKLVKSHKLYHNFVAVTLRNVF